ncbi:MAG: aminotransferase class V-fold PLP-dependent enzyme [Candidatus Bathyarchaeota archaeon]|nr:aminotransferase class V-fold PLP-dependent enzyme [Candidatus Bathyarchaeota archaeon]
MVIKNSGDQLMSIYDELGVKRVINAIGTVTFLGGSVILPEAVKAMSEAAKAFVNIDELQKRAGEIIAEITGTEAACVTSGAAAGLVLAVAACMTGDDPEKMAKIPYINFPRNEVIVPAMQDNPYVRNLAIPCAKIIKVGTEQGYTPEDIERAINERTAAIAFIFFTSKKGCDLEALKEVVKIGKKHNVPVIVDAAAELPPIENLRNIAATGADLVVFSGGKDIRGPNDTGFVIGRADLIRAIVAHSSPHHYMGRPMKVSKEDIVGLLVALKHYTPEAVEARKKRWEEIVQYFIRELSSEHVSVERMMPDPSKHEYSAQGWPRARLTFNESLLGITAAEIHRMLLEGSPPIYAHHSGNQIIINPQCLQDGDEAIIAERIKEILRENMSGRPRGEIECMT